MSIDTVRNDDTTTIVFSFLNSLFIRKIEKTDFDKLGVKRRRSRKRCTSLNLSANQFVIRTASMVRASRRTYATVTHTCGFPLFLN